MKYQYQLTKFPNYFMIIANNNTYIGLLSGFKLSEIQLYSRSSNLRVKNLLQMLQK